LFQRSGSIWSTRLSGCLLIVALLALWEFSARVLVQSPNWPPFTDVMQALAAGLTTSELPTVFASTIGRMLAGFTIGAAIAIAVGLAMGSSRFVHHMLQPAIEFLRPLPVPGIIPPLILLLGIDDKMKIFVVAFSAFFPVVINTAQGVRTADPTLVATARTFRHGRFRVMRSIILPASLPYIFSGLRISLALALIVTIVAEMISGSQGLGHYLITMQYAMRAADMYAGVVLIAAAGYLLNLSFLAVEHRVIHWYFANQG
jgi:ABC-type nitrate/sulfonate/bicarbonate transport system permease component